MSKKTRFKKYLKKYNNYPYKPNDLAIGYLSGRFYPFIIGMVDIHHGKIIGFYSTRFPINSRGEHIYVHKCIPYNNETKSLLN